MGQEEYKLLIKSFIIPRVSSKEALIAIAEDLIKTIQQFDLSFYLESKWWN